MGIIQPRKIASYSLDRLLRGEDGAQELERLLAAEGTAPLPASRMAVPLNRRDFMRIGTGGLGALVVGGTLRPTEAEAIAPLLLALIGVFTVATIAWAVSEPVSGRIALINNSEQEQNGQCLFTAYKDFNFTKRASYPIEEWRKAKEASANKRVFGAAADYQINKRTVDVYDVAGLRSNQRTSQLTLAAETSRDYSTITEINVA